MAPTPPTDDTADPWADAPYVCPGCHAVDEPCYQGCIDAEIALANSIRDYDAWEEYDDGRYDDD